MAAAILRRSYIRCLLCLALVLAFQGSLFAQDSDVGRPEKAADANELAEEVTSSVEGSIVDGNFREVLEATGPVFTHRDDVGSSTLWICPDAKGRLEVVLAFSSWRERKFIEVCSFSEHPLEFKILETKWNPTPARNPFDIKDAPRPADTEAGRLEQMKELLKRFGASEEYLGGEVEFEIRPEPVYRYPKSSREHDGGVFALLRDGDPEALLVLETTKDGWQYMFGRMSANRMSYTLDGKQMPVELVRSPNAPYIVVRR